MTTFTDIETVVPTPAATAAPTAAPGTTTTTIPGTTTSATANGLKEGDYGPWHCSPTPQCGATLPFRRYTFFRAFSRQVEGGICESICYCSAAAS